MPLRTLPPTTGSPNTPQQGPQIPPAPGAGGAGASGGLPPTGLQQQLNSLNSYYTQVQNARIASAQGGMNNIGFDVRAHQFGNAESMGMGAELEQDAEIGSTSLDAMARNLAQRYGMPVGRGRIVDEYGNFLMTPQQMADASGGSLTLGEAAAQMNYISSALTRRQNEDQQSKGMAALQAGLGQVQSRGRGSLAAMMSGYYQDIADLYANKEYEAADFSYYIEKEKLDIEAELRRRAEKKAKQQSRSGFVVGLAMTVASLYTGNVAGAAAGVSMVASSYEGTGWF